MTEWFIIIVVGAFLFWCKVCFWISAQVGILRENLRLKEDPKLIHLDGYGIKILFNHGVRRFMTRQNSRDAWLPELARLCQVLSSAFFVSNCWIKNAMRYALRTRGCDPSLRSWRRPGPCLTMRTWRERTLMRVRPHQRRFKGVCHQSCNKRQPRNPRTPALCPHHLCR